MKKVLFIVTYKHLSFPVINSLLTILKEKYKNYVIYFDEPFIRQNITSDEISKSNLSEFQIISSTEIKAVKQIISEKKIISRLFWFLSNLYKYRKEIIRILAEISPDAILTTTDSSFVTRIINNYAEKKKHTFNFISVLFY